MTTESELGRHTVDCGAREDNGDTWVFAEANESVDSFTGAFPPRSCGKEWIAARHDGRSALAGGGSAEDEAEEKGGGNRAEAEEEKGGSKAEAEAKKAWQAVGSKSLSTLTATLKAHNFGRGKWLIQAEAEEVDEMWRKIVAALWEGKLGSSAKVSGAGMQMAHGGHIICVYVSPFWDTSEVERGARRPGRRRRPPPPAAPSAPARRPARAALPCLARAALPCLSRAALPCCLARAAQPPRDCPPQSSALSAPSAAWRTRSSSRRTGWGCSACQSPTSGASRPPSTSRRPGRWT